jgi:hypothetical protein|tara:strand:+ start:263 stop:748 length:486 start_codon:yes stop_codon:yes gene_type:complete
VHILVVPCQVVITIVVLAVVVPVVLVAEVLMLQAIDLLHKFLLMDLVVLVSRFQLHLEIQKQYMMEYILVLSGILLAVEEVDYSIHHQKLTQIEVAKVAVVMVAVEILELVIRQALDLKVEMVSLALAAVVVELVHIMTPQNSKVVMVDLVLFLLLIPPDK